MFSVVVGAVFGTRMSGVIVIIAMGDERQPGYHGHHKATPRPGPTTAENRRVHQPAENAADAADIVHGFLEIVDDVVRQVPAQFMCADDQDVATHPQQWPQCQ